MLLITYKQYKYKKKNNQNTIENTIENTNLKENLIEKENILKII